MAPASTTETVRITVDEQELEVPKGELVVEAVKRLGIEIPVFCYHSRLKPVGMCRMCLVKVGFLQKDGSVRMMPKPQTACTLPASDGMVIITEDEGLRNDRKGILEFLLINHPLDCPICDRGGECPLQNNTLFYGPATSRFVEMKRHAPKAYRLSEHVMLDLERCIQCGRCVRFTEEISGDAQLAFRYRGANMQPSTFQLTEFESKFSGNVIEICPVGALTSAHYRFRARPWDLETTPGLCTRCSNGCNVWLDHRAGKLVRVNGRTNEAVNEEWTCDRGKFGHDFMNAEDRLTAPLIRKGEGYEETGWAEAYAPILQAFQGGGAQVAALVDPTIPNEGLYLLKKLFVGAFGSPNIDHRWTAALPAQGEEPETQPTPIADLEAKGSILVFGSSLADEEPIVYLRVRKAWFNNKTRVVVASSERTDADDFAAAVLRYKPGTGDRVAAGLAALMGGKGPSPEDVARESGVSVDELKAAAEALKCGPAQVVATRAIYDQPKAKETLAALDTLAKQAGAAMSLYATGANEQGALELGLTPGESGMNTAEVLKAAADGKLKALWLVGADPLALFPDKELARRALENVDFLVYMGANQTEAAHYASVVLPMAAPAEQEGTWTNVERRVQRMTAAVKAPGQARAAWQVFSECLLQATGETPAFNPREVYGEIARLYPAYAGTEGSIEGEGVMLAGVN